MKELIEKMKALSAELEKWEARAKEEKDEAKRGVYDDEVEAKRAEFEKLEGQLAALTAKDKRDKVIADAEAEAEAVDTSAKDGLGNVKLADSEHNAAKALQDRDGVSRAYMFAPLHKCPDALRVIASKRGDTFVDQAKTDEGVRLPSRMDNFLVWGYRGVGAKAGTNDILTSDAAGSQSGGGGLVEDTFVPELFKLPQLNANLMQFCRVKRGVGGSALFPTLTQTSASPYGVDATWDTEGSAATESDPQFNQTSVGTNRLALFTDVSQKALRVNDVGLEAELAWMFRGEFQRTIDVAIIAGIGTTQPQGVNIDASITSGVNTLARETVDQISYKDLSDLQFQGEVGTRASSMYVLSDGVSSAYQYIMGLDDTNGRPVLRSQDTGWEQGPLPRLLGFRYLTTEANTQNVGNRGDVIFGDWNQYAVVVDLETSIARSDDFKFTSGLVVFRVFAYIGGQPLGFNAFSLLADSSGESSSSSSSSSG
jgi:HK97 family phage major capsid protein